MLPLTEELTAQPDEPVTETVGRLGASAAGRLIVMENGQMVGLVTLRAVLRWLAMTRRRGKRKGADPCGPAPDRSHALAKRQYR